MSSYMAYDDVAWEKSDTVFEDWQKTLLQEDNLYAIGALIHKHRRGVPDELCFPVCGSFNVCVRLKFQDGSSAMIRFPSPGRSMFPEEKVRAEVAAIRYIADKTTIPVPFILHSGLEDSPADMGPYILMDYIEHDRLLVQSLNIPGRSDDEPPLLDPEISEEKIEFLYSQMAEILLKLSRPSLPRIGSLSEIDEDEWSVNQRPLTLNMNELVSLGNYPRTRLPTDTFSTASSYYASLADMHFEHLATQRNDAITSSDDCRRKYVARCLFRQLAAAGRLDGTPAECEHGPFKLFCDDLRPANVLVTAADTVAAVIDLEFSNALPAGFACSPPWWLLLERPEKWPWGIRHWAEHFEARLATFLTVLEGHEDEARQRGLGSAEEGGGAPPLSARMRESWASGAFWVNYAARKSWAFDLVWFTFLDRRFFGGEEEGDGDGDGDGDGEVDEGWLARRLPLLSEEERAGMEPFVRRKMAEMEERTLTQWDSEPSRG